MPNISAQKLCFPAYPTFFKINLLKKRFQFNQDNAQFDIIKVSMFVNSKKNNFMTLYKKVFFKVDEYSSIGYFHVL